MAMQNPLKRSTVPLNGARRKPGNSCAVATKLIQDDLCNPFKLWRDFKRQPKKTAQWQGAPPHCLTVFATFEGTRSLKGRQFSSNLFSAPSIKHHKLFKKFVIVDPSQTFVSEPWKGQHLWQFCFVGSVQAHPCLWMFCEFKTSAMSWIGFANCLGEHYLNPLIKVQCVEISSWSFSLLGG